MATANLTIDGEEPSYQYIESHTGSMSCWGVITHRYWWKTSLGYQRFFAMIGKEDGFIHADDVVIDYCPMLTKDAIRTSQPCGAHILGATVQQVILDDVAA